MTDSFRALISASGFAAAALLQTYSPFATSARDDRWGFGYCAPPYPPERARARPGGHPATATCEREVDSYVAAVFRYRLCLTNEMERAVREANQMVQSVKCPKDKRFCYGLPREATP